MQARIRFHIGLAVAYAVATLLLIGGVIGYLFYSASNLAVETAQRSMAQATEDIELSVNSLFSPVARSVRSTAYLLEKDTLDHTGEEGMQFLLRQIEAMPEVASLFIAFQDTGRFVQVVRMVEEDEQGQLTKERLFIREMPRAPGDLLERSYSADAGAPAQSSPYAKNFDPRVRPWYVGALESGTLTLSDPYIFASTGTTGITVSQQALGPDGAVLAVVGADITLEGLGHYLGQKRVGENGRTFILDGNDDLIVVSHGDTFDNAEHRAIGRHRVDDAIRMHRDSGVMRFSMEGPRPVMAAFRPFPPEFGKPWVIGVLADRAEMVGGIRQTTGRSILVALVYTVLAIAGMVYLSRRITQPLRRIIHETENIRQFRLDEPFSLRSPIVEIDNLSDSVANMKNGLRGFKAFVPVELVQTILSSGKAVEIGGEIREVTLMFTDIEGFSGKTEHLSSSVVFEDLSTYFGAISDQVQAHNGTVDKFIGDAVMAMWNAPQEDPDHAVNACRAALASVRVGEALRSDHGNGESLFPVKTRFGLHLGEVIVGNVGSNHRMQYTALGKDVNLASRLEGMNKEYGTYVLVTDRVAERVKDLFVLRPVDLAVAAGTTEPVQIFEVLAEVGQDESAGAPAKASAWQECMAAYGARDWDAALAAFQKFAQTYPDDQLARLYVERCEAFKTEPPSSDWDGVFIHKSK